MRVDEEELKRLVLAVDKAIPFLDWWVDGATTDQHFTFETIRTELKTALLPFRQLGWATDVAPTEHLH